MSKARKPLWSSRRFVTAPYGTPEELSARLRNSSVWCPERADDLPCRLGAHGYSVRLKCPVHRLLRVKCFTHDKTFILYPPGLTPYARRSHLPLDHRGNVIQASDGKPAWDQTDLEAALDYAQGVTWPESRDVAVLEEREHLPVRKTQERWIFGLLLFLGLIVGRQRTEQMEDVMIVTGCRLSEWSAACVEIASPTELNCRDGPLREKVEWAANCLKSTRPSTQSLQILNLGCGPEFWGTAQRL